MSLKAINTRLAKQDNQQKGQTRSSSLGKVINVIGVIDDNEDDNNIQTTGGVKASAKI